MALVQETVEASERRMYTNATGCCAVEAERGGKRRTALMSRRPSPRSLCQVRRCSIRTVAPPERRRSECQPATQSRGQGGRRCCAGMAGAYQWCTTRLGTRPWRSGCKHWQRIRASRTLGSSQGLRSCRCRCAASTARRSGWPRGCPFPGSSCRARASRTCWSRACQRWPRSSSRRCKTERNRRPFQTERWASLGR